MTADKIQEFAAYLLRGQIGVRTLEYVNYDMELVTIYYISCHGKVVEIIMNSKNAGEYAQAFKERLREKLKFLASYSDASKAFRETVAVGFNRWYECEEFLSESKD